MNKYVKIALTVLFMLTPLYGVWLFYLVVMTLKRAKEAGTLSLPALIMGMPLVWIGVALDAITNITVCTVIFLELPQETLITSRLQRLILEEGWRSNLAGFICADLLNAFDPSGNHCK